MMLDGILGILILLGGVYCLYAFCMLKLKKQVNQTILLPKGTNIRECKDLNGYCKEVQLPLFLLGITTTLHGCVDVYNTMVERVGTLFIATFSAVVVVLIVYTVMIRKINTKYFGK